MFRGFLVINWAARKHHGEKRVDSEFISFWIKTLGKFWGLLLPYCCIAYLKGFLGLHRGSLRVFPHTHLTHGRTRFIGKGGGLSLCPAARTNVTRQHPIAFRKTVVFKTLLLFCSLRKHSLVHNLFSKHCFAVARDCA